MNRFLVSFSVLKLKSQILPNQPTNIYIYNLTAYKLFVITGARGQGPEPLTLENFQKFKIHIVKVQSPSSSHAPPPQIPYLHQKQSGTAHVYATGEQDIPYSM